MKKGMEGHYGEGIDKYTHCIIIIEGVHNQLSSEAHMPSRRQKVVFKKTQNKLEDIVMYQVHESPKAEGGSMAAQPAGRGKPTPEAPAPVTPKKDSSFKRVIAAGVIGIIAGILVATYMSDCTWSGWPRLAAVCAECPQQQEVVAAVAPTAVPTVAPTARPTAVPVLQPTKVAAVPPSSVRCGNTAAIVEVYNSTSKEVEVVANPGRGDFRKTIPAKQIWYVCFNTRTGSNISFLLPSGKEQLITYTPGKAVYKIKV